MKNPFNNLFNRKKDENRTPLILMWEFTTGDKIYSYDKDHYGTIASRYLKILNRSFNALKAYGQGESVANAAWNKVKELFHECATGNDVTSNAMKGYTIAETQLQYVGNKTAIEFEQLKLIFLTFHLLNDETMGSFDEAINIKKFELISNDDNCRDFFFQRARDISENLGILLEKDIPDKILEMAAMIKQGQKIQ